MFIDILVAFIAIVVYKISELFNYEHMVLKKFMKFAVSLFIIMLIFHISYNWQWINTQIFGKNQKKRKTIKRVCWRLQL
jgi:uncharacterized membrane protein (DUF485 family)